MFLTDDELRRLTGRARKAQQADELRRMGIAHWINARGQPVVARAAIEGAKSATADKTPPTWEPRRRAAA